MCCGEILNIYQEAPVSSGGRGVGSAETEEEERWEGGGGAAGQGDAQHGGGEGDPAGGERCGRANTL